MQTCCPQTRRHGFSLIELLIVVALILILAVLYYGGSSRSIQSRHKAACQKNLVTLHLALQFYANDTEGAFPTVANAKTSEEPLSLLVPKYTATTEPFICPGSKDPRLPEGQSFKGQRISYAYYMGWRATNSSEVIASDRQVNRSPKTAGQPLFSIDGKGPGSNHRQYGGNLLFVDGHAEMVPNVTPRDLAPPPSVTLLNPASP